MSIWNIEILIEGTDHSLNFIHETDHNDEMRIYTEIENVLTIVPTLIQPEPNES
jgi:hypothetical protein